MPQQTNPQTSNMHLNSQPFTMPPNQQSSNMFSDTRSQQSAKSSKSKKSVKKQILIGPKNNQIDLKRILLCRQSYDEECESLTTLMIKNIPIKFLQQDMLHLINRNF